MRYTFKTLINYKLSLFALILSLNLFPFTSFGQLNPDSLLQKTTEIVKEFFYRQQDTNYITNYNDDLSIRLMAVNKSNYFKLRDNSLGNSVRYRPDRKINLGIGLTYKWFSVDIVFGSGIGENDQSENTKIRDIRANVFTNKHFVSGFYQYYLGYKLTSSSAGDINSDSEKLRDDIRTVNVGLEYLYVFDYNKFSLKAPFSHNEIQKKSAGSLVAGAGLSLNLMDGDSSLIPSSQQGQFDERLNFTDIYATAISLNAGYVYSFVAKQQFFVTIGLIPGISFTSGDFYRGKRTLFGTSIFPRLQTMNAIGWSRKRFFVSLEYMASIDFYRPGNDIGIDFGKGKFKFKVGYRFWKQKNLR